MPRHSQRQQTFLAPIICACLALSFLLSACNKKPAESAAPMSAAILEEKVAPPPAAAPAAAPAPAAAADAMQLSKTKEVNKVEAEVSNAARSASGKADLAKQIAVVSPVGGIEQLSSSVLSATSSEHKFVRSATATFLVKDVYRAALAIEDIAASHAGFVLDNDIENKEQRHQSMRIADSKKLEVSEYVINGRLILRIPSAKTQDFLRAIAGQIVFLDKRSFAAHDVQFDLLRQQLEYRRSQETQEDLGQIVNDGAKIYHKADVISSRSDFKAARDAALVSQKEALNNVAYATIDLNLYQLPEVRKYEVQDIDAVFEQYRPTFSSRVADALSGGWLALIDLMIALLAAWPLLLLVMLATIAWRMKRAKRADRVK